MIKATSLNQTQRKRRQNAAFDGHVSDFVNSCDLALCETPPQQEDQPWPQAFLVEQLPSFVIPVHFHRRDQFQVVTAGSGSLGRHRVAPLAMHYASAESGYGPITAGPEGLSYLTLRAKADFGAAVLPGARGEMRKGLTKHQETVEPPKRISADALAQSSAPSVEVLIPPTANGLAGYLVRMPPNQTMTPPPHGDCGGRFYIVTLGSLLAHGGWQPALATVFVSADEAFELASGPDGLEALIAQFPVDTSAVT